MHCGCYDVTCVVGDRLPKTLYSLFWSMFGLVPVEKVEIKYPNKGHDSVYASSFPSGRHATSVVEGVGLFLFALYHVALIIVLTNMLIAMMSHSFEAIQASTNTLYTPSAYSVPSTAKNKITNLITAPKSPIKFLVTLFLWYLAQNFCIIS